MVRTKEPGLGRGCVIVLLGLMAACVSVDGSEELGSVQQPLLVSFDFFQGGPLPFPAGTGGAGAGGTAGTGGTYAGATDALIAKANPTTNYGESTTCTVDGPTTDRACLLRWDLSTIPPNWTVQQASIILTLEDGTSQFFFVHTLIRSWTESQVTWNKATSAQNWGTPGAQSFASDRVSPIMGQLAGGVGQRTIVLNQGGILTVQGWVINPATNKGFVISGGAGDEVRFRSSENSVLNDRPKLRVTFSIPACC
jgi:hypothetical protein